MIKNLRTLSIGLLLALLTACAPDASPDPDQAIAELTAHLDSLSAQEAFSGEVLITKNQNVLLNQSWGVADRKTKRPLQGGEKFRLGSLNKMFTAIAIIKLAEEDKLALDAPLSRYLPDYQNQALADAVTVRHLLTHTGGTGDIFGPRFDQHKSQLKTHADYVALFEDRPATQPPGQQFQYSNFGYLLLGRIIENVTGESYYHFLDTHLFAPLGMDDTGFDRVNEQVPDLAQGYTRQNDRWVSNRATLPWRGTAAGGGYSTAADLLTFARALQNGAVISKASLKEATRQHVAMGDAGYGYGMGVFGEGKRRFYGHNGGAPGMSAWLSVYPNAGYIVIVLSNYDPPVADEVHNFFAERMPLD